MSFGGKFEMNIPIKKFIFCLNISGREGYMSLLNTDVRKELDNFAAFLRMAVEHKKKIGFKGQLLIEPKPKEPTKHQCKLLSFFLKTISSLFHFR